jgi:hypothetical protein
MTLLLIPALAWLLWLAVDGDAKDRMSDEGQR